MKEDSDNNNLLMFMMMSQQECIPTVTKMTETIEPIATAQQPDHYVIRYVEKGQKLLGISSFVRNFVFRR